MFLVLNKIDVNVGAIQFHDKAISQELTIKKLQKIHSKNSQENAQNNTLRQRRTRKTHKWENDKNTQIYKTKYIRKEGENDQ